MAWRRRLRVLAAMLAAALVAHLSWLGPQHSVHLMILPLLLLAARSGVEHALIMFGYFGYNAIELPSILLRFFGGGHVWLAYLAPLLLSVLLSLPFALISREASASGRFFRSALAFALTVIPPLGFIGWLSPLYVAGVLYPGWGVVGLVLALLAMAALAAGKMGRGGVVLSFSVCVLLPLAANLLYEGPKQSGVRIKPTVTWLGKPSTDPSYRVRAWEEMRHSVEPHIGHGWPDVVVFPESIIHGFGDLDHVGLGLLRNAQGRPDVWFGATLEAEDGRVENVILDLDGRVIARTRLPVPIGNWRPFMRGGVPARPFESDLVDAHGKRLAVSICYEDVVIWPHSGLLTWRSDAMISVANMWALDGTRTSGAQDVAARLLARMAGVPLYRSVNRYGG